MAYGGRRGLPGLAGAGLPLHAGHQRPPLLAHVGQRQDLPVYHPVHPPGAAAPRQPRHDIHQRARVVDDLWTVLGTTNIDNRSFEHNDEDNVAMCDAAVAARLLEDYERDLAGGYEVTLERCLWERLAGPFIWILERQQ
jgi:phosphatidylserine/phosphatidylglycerophosphate/cardiolipin synthase-like enzyme